ncbi:MAG: ribonuclease P protein component [Candidatus Cloacimonetes bacterium]|jgi:ribonuclease P protein component|nr:ribonuclease P protein component [Candidatus Cloacimonadota bacterium]NLO43880.1 ribonuclease P protein component [Candidatus Cloacimonadota bacterium]
MIRWITSHPEYVEFSKCRRSVKSEHFKLLLLPDAQGSAVGITISKKIANAVGRNLLKRRIKAWLRASAMILPENLKMNIIAQKGAADLSWQDLCDELEGLVKCINQQG